ncbi:PKD domain-containing protein (plasmid) [Flammeovirgaceae bacterium SG7u.111]|nr:PKD domain-containing protein [Flammeovirgaceae bacterium SG7u.132]WPO38840.1 PKD domain-containing protein [Flammeovirgaceae bacterium SG7u.111]
MKIPTVYCYIGLVILLLNTNNLMAQDVANQTTKQTSGGTSYLEYLPEDYATSGEDYPVMIFLHGLGEKGSDITKVATHGPPKHIKNGNKMTFEVDGETFSFIVISPQLKGNYGNWPTNYVKEVFDHVKNIYRIDENRIYITGLSLGGGGTWNFAVNYPEEIAAIAAICGTTQGYTAANACKIGSANLPVWAFHGENDGTVSPNASKNWVNSINACNPDPLALLTLYPGIAHNAWDRAYQPDHQFHNPNVYEWLLSYNKNKVYVGTGSNRSIEQPKDSVHIQANISVPEPGSETYTWEQVNGPTTAALSGTNTATLVAQSLEEGTYTFKLSVTANSITESDEIDITVTKPNVAPIADAGLSRTVVLPKDTVKISGAQSYDSDGSISAYQWKQTGGPSSGVKVLINFTNADETLGTPWNNTPNAFRNQTMSNLVAESGATTNISLQMFEGWWDVNTLGVTTGNDSGVYPDNVMKTNYWLNDNPVKLRVANLEVGQLYNFTFFGSRSGVTDNRATTYTIGSETVSLNAASNKDQTISITEVSPNASGEVVISIDKASGSSYGYLAAMEIETGVSSVKGVNEPVLTLSSLTEGTYKFELEVTDDLGKKAKDNVTINATSDTNQAPVAKAGNDISIVAPVAAVTLNGGTSSDSDGSIESYKWSKKSGPADFTIASPDKAQTEVTGLVLGVYVFELEVTDDKGKTDTDEVTVTVTSTENEAPVAKAGNDISIVAPAAAVTLNGGTSSDSDGSIESYKWSKKSGPADFTIESPDKAQTEVTGLVPGKYVFELEVTDDKGKIGTDEIVVDVFNADGDCGCDHVLGESTDQIYIDGSTMDIQPGDVICIQAGNYKFIQMWNFEGSEEDPITIKNCGGQVVIGDGTFHYGFILKARYFRLTGTGDSNFKYGIKIAGTGKDAINLGIGGTSTHFEVDHIESANAGFAGIMIKEDPKCNNPETWRRNFEMQNVKVHDCYIHDSGGEGFYFGYTFSNTGIDCNGETIFGHLIKDIHIYNNIIENAGWDGIQLGSAYGDVRIYNNHINNYGTQDELYQQTGLQVALAYPTNDNGQSHIYNNLIENGTGPGTLIGGTSANFYNNIYRNVASSSNHVNDGIYIGNGAKIHDNGFNFINNMVFAHSNARYTIMGANNQGTSRIINNIANVDIQGGDKKQTNLIASDSSELKTLVEDKGTNTAAYGVTFDFNNNTRPQGGAFDIGPYEFVKKKTNEKPVVVLDDNYNITLPADSLIIDGSASYDPDGEISSYLWEQASGSYTLSLTNPTKEKLIIKELKVGDFEFSLTVTDDSGAVDTQSFTVTIDSQIVIPPPTEATPIPTKVTASDTSFTDKIEVSWDKPEFSGKKLYYAIYRSNSSDTTSAQLISSWLFDQSSFIDSSLVADTEYYYFVKAAISNTGEMQSFFSIGDIGSTKKETEVVRLIKVDKQLLEFGDVLFGDSSSAKFTIANVGENSLSIDSIITPAPFYSNWHSGTLGAGEQKEIEVKFIPSDTVSYFKSIVIFSNASPSEKVVNVSGKGYMVLTGLERIDNDTDILAYPNPFINDLSLELGNDYLGKVDITILNSSGAFVKAYHIDKTRKVINKYFDLYQLPEGLYVLKISFGDKFVTKKIIKTN